ncbi:unnamed protein product [Wickerhamomyces anomalus]
MSGTDKVDNIVYGGQDPEVFGDLAEEARQRKKNGEVKPYEKYLKTVPAPGGGFHVVYDKDAKERDDAAKKDDQK